MGVAGKILGTGAALGGAYLIYRIGAVLYEDHKLAEKAKHDPLGLLGDQAARALKQAGMIVAPKGNAPPEHVPAAPPANVATPPQIQAITDAGWQFFQSAAKAAQGAVAP